MRQAENMMTQVIQIPIAVKYEYAELKIEDIKTAVRTVSTDSLIPTILFEMKDNQKFEVRLDECTRACVDFQHLSEIAIQVQNRNRNKFYGG